MWVPDCDPPFAPAGGGATGHPVEWIQLDRRAGRAGERLPETCKYCGIRYVMTEEAVHSH